MKTKEALESIYNVINELLGPIEAKNTVSDAIFNIITDLHDEGLPITGEAIKARLVEYAKDFAYAAQKKSDVA